MKTVDCQGKETLKPNIRGSNTEITILSRLMPSVCSELGKILSCELYGRTTHHFLGGGLGVGQFANKVYSQQQLLKKQEEEERWEKTKTRPGAFYYSG